MEAGEYDGRGLETVYTEMFRAYGLLPGEIAKQDPILLFMTLDGLHEEENREIPDSLKFFYGL